MFSLLLARIRQNTWSRLVPWAPFLILAFDYAENASIVTMLIGYPGTLFIAPVAAFFTTTKWLVVLANAGILGWTAIEAFQSIGSGFEPPGGTLF